MRNPTAMALAAVLLVAPIVRADPISFRNDVMAVLSKAGCNQGACHGNQNGKNGFKLSLRGQDAALDYEALTRDTHGRRANPHHVADSLLLLKAVAAVPHEGGRRFDVASPEYALLYRWIAEGMRPDAPTAPALQALSASPSSHILMAPADRVGLRATATFSDGTTREVTRLAVFESSNPAVSILTDGTARRGETAGLCETAITIRYLDRHATVQLAFVPARPGFVWPDPPVHNFIDRHVFAKLRALQIMPAPLCSDAVFLRRVYLDVLGVLPTVEEVRGFLADPRPDKRDRLIDPLLQRPEFADFWALKWSDLLRNEEKTLDRKGVAVFHQWIRQSIADGKPLNAFARELLAARGSTYANPAANFYRAVRDPSSRAEAAAQVFLGVRLQCARCHNHPFDRWTQDDYYGLAACFARIQYKILENRRRDRFDQHEFDGEQVVWTDRVSEIKHPRTSTSATPRFPGATSAVGPDRLQALADWVADSANPFFAKAQVNRVWFHLMGRGLVEPNDDFRATNPPANGPLLDALAQDFAAHQFDLRALIKTIVQSRTYQLSATPNDTNRDDEANGSHALIRPLPAEVLLDAMAQVLAVPPTYSGYPAGTRAVQLAGVPPARERGRDRRMGGEVFLKRFGKPERLLSCECERSDDTTLGKTFQLLTGDLLNRMLTARENRLGRLLTAGRSDRDIVVELYLAALSRMPTEPESQAAVAYLQKADDRRAALEDVAWGLLNAKELLLRH